MRGTVYKLEDVPPALRERAEYLNNSIRHLDGLIRRELAKAELGRQLPTLGCGGGCATCKPAGHDTGEKDHQ
ncbi:MAG: hypothetical protein AB200_01295 [Parcubacteria bacterium C7867-005]|nr:MAG: hypothetical protein AB200_01295 [Parcubacteria bacterium C7867-005]